MNQDNSFLECIYSGYKYIDGKKGGLQHPITPGMDVDVKVYFDMVRGCLTISKFDEAYVNVIQHDKLKSGEYFLTVQMMDDSEALTIKNPTKMSPLQSGFEW